MKHFVSVAILVAISTVLLKMGLDAVGLLPVEASAQARRNGRGQAHRG